MKKLDIKYVTQEYKRRGFTLYKQDWDNAEKPCKCSDEDGYLYEKTLSNVRQINPNNRRSFTKPFEVRNKYYWENVLHYMDNMVTNGAILISTKEDFTSANSKLLFQCPLCGSLFRRTWKSFIDLDNKICTSCYKEMRPKEPYIESRRNDISKYISAAQRQGLTILDNYIPNNKTKVRVEDKDGYRGVIHATTLLNGSTFEKWSTYRNPYIHYNLQKFIQHQGFNTKVIKVKKDEVELKCECGERYVATKDHLIYGTQCLCKRCTKSMSLLEQKVERWLIDNNIDYKSQHTFDNLVGIGGNPLRFDFYIESCNVCVEVNGEQHYKPISFGGDAHINFQRVQEHDKRKEIYCNENGIQLIKLPYWTIEKNDDYIKILEKSPIKG